VSCQSRERRLLHRACTPSGQLSAPWTLLRISHGTGEVLERKSAISGQSHPSDRAFRLCSWFGHGFFCDPEGSKDAPRRYCSYARAMCLRNNETLSHRHEKISVTAATVDAIAFYPQIKRSSRAPVAQLDRASDYGSEGLRFESPRARFLSSWI
jgi:hypothetical protein